MVKPYQMAIRRNSVAAQYPGEVKEMPAMPAQIGKTAAPVRGERFTVRGTCESRGPRRFTSIINSLRCPPLGDASAG
jgi:hypothetical protein